MGKQLGPIKVQGTLGNVTFAETKDGSIVKRKSSLTRRKIRTLAAFWRTREINAQFSIAAKAGKLLRQSIEELLKDTKDSKLHSRLLKQFWNVLEYDTTNPPGSRSATKGKLSLLENFDFNIKSHFSSILSKSFTTTINRTTGELTYSVESFVPIQSLSAPAGATHFRIVTAGVEVNFDESTFISDQSDSEVQPYNDSTTGVITLSNALTPGTNNPLFLVSGVRFYNKINGVLYRLKDAMYNPLTIVKMDVG